MRNIAIFVQARMNSSRTPGKVLHDIFGQPMLLRQLMRLKEGCGEIKLVCLTSNLNEDDPIAELCEKHGFDCYRGPLNNVLLRYILAAEHYNLEYILRVGGDDPLIDPNVCKQLIKKYDGEDFFFSSHRKGWPYGCAAELITLESLKRILESSKDNLFLEHIIPWFHNFPEKSKIRKLYAPKEINRPDYYFSVDYPEDLELIKVIFSELSRLGDYFSLTDVIEFCDQNQDILQINQHLHEGFDS